MSVRFCPYCGRELYGSEKFCPKCGNLISQPSGEGTEVVRNSGVEMDASATCDDCGRHFRKEELKGCIICGRNICPECWETHEAYYHPVKRDEAVTGIPVMGKDYSNVSKNKKRKIGVKKLLITAIVVILIMVACAGIFFFFNSGSSSGTSSSGGSTNNAAASIVGTWAYTETGDDYYYDLKIICNDDNSGSYIENHSTTTDGVLSESASSVECTWTKIDENQYVLSLISGTESGNTDVDVSYNELCMLLSSDGATVSLGTSFELCGTSGLILIKE